MTTADLSPRARAWNASLTASPGPLDLTIDRARLEGDLPAALRGGRVLSNGPGWTHIGGRLAHPFDGHGYVRAFEFLEDGAVRLRARFVQTRVYRDEAAAQRLVHRGLGTNLGPHFWQNLQFGSPRNVANTTITRWGGRLLAGWEGGPPHALDPDSLETTGVETFGGALEGQATLAHTKHDVARRRLVHCSIAMGPKTKLTFREMNERNEVVDTREVAVPGMLFAHDFAITPNWYVLVSNPLKVKFGQFARTLVGASTLINSITADGAAPGAVYLVPRGAPGPVRTVTLPDHAFVVHYGNAFEREGSVHLDACLFHHFEFGAEFGFRGPDAPLDPALPDTRAPQRLFRITIPAEATTATWQQLVPHGVDFPRVHPAHDGLETPLLFAATRADTRHSDPFDSLLSLDLRDLAKPPQVWSTPTSVFVGEPLFAPSAARDDAGYVLAMLSDGLEGCSTLAVFDATALAAGPVCRVPLPLLPYAFHGAWDQAR